MFQSFIQPRQGVSQNIRGGQQRPMNIATSPAGQPINYAPPMQAPTMFVQGNPQFVPGQHQVITLRGPPPTMQVPVSLHT